MTELSQQEADRLIMLGHLETAKKRAELFIADMDAFRVVVHGYAHANDLEHKFSGTGDGLDDAQIDADGKEIDLSAAGVADRLVDDAYRAAWKIGEMISLLRLSDTLRALAAMKAEGEAYEAAITADRAVDREIRRQSSSEDRR
jgi:hypothetical protein